RANASQHDAAGAGRGALGAGQKSFSHHVSPVCRASGRSPGGEDGSIHLILPRFNFIEPEKSLASWPRPSPTTLTQLAREGLQNVVRLEPGPTAGRQGPLGALGEDYRLLRITRNQMGLSHGHVGLCNTVLGRIGPCQGAVAAEVVGTRIDR